MAVAAMGTKLFIGLNSIAELSSVSGLELSADTIETTNLDSGGWRQFIQGVKDGGEVSISGYFNPGDTNGQKAVYDAFGTGAVTTFKIAFPSTLGAEWQFNGIVTGVTTGAEMEDTVTFEATIKVTGTPALGLTASANASNIAFTGGSPTLSPTFIGSKYVYSVTFSGVSSTQISVTASGQTILLYIDGALSQTLQSGVNSSSISFAAAESKLFTVVINEPGKTQKIYELAVVRTA